MKRRAIAALVLGVTALALSSILSVAAVGAKSTGASRQYVVLYEKGVSVKAARAAIKKAGGKVLRENAAIGLATVVSRNANFVRAATATKPLRSASRNRPFGRSFAARQKHLDLAQLDRALGSAGPPAVAPRASDDDDDDDGDRGHHRRGHKKSEPFAALQWDMQMIHATRKGSYDEEKGNKKVLVGVIDSGIDGTHPDIAPNFDRELSRNFAADIPGLDNGCGALPAPCLDPADVDGDALDGHGTHVAGTIGAAINGLGTSGVAPKVTLVNLRAGQDSGYFFLQATLDAMTYAADNGIDVVNMSYFTDPWLFNCRANPADSPAEQAEQRLIIDATQRAADYARANGVTLVAALGNEAIDLGKPTYDPLDPTRPVDNTCINVPTETDGVISVSSLGPTGTKSDFSNYGVEQTDLSAPGGFFHDSFGTTRFQATGNLILSTYPQSAAVANKQLNPDGAPNVADVLRDCKDGVCGYYRYNQGTSMASPHVAGVAALIVSEYGSKRHGNGITMDPVEVERILKETATDTACPTPALVDYPVIGESEIPDALCEGTAQFNGFYGHGIVDALAAVTSDDHHDRGHGHDDDHDESDHTDN